MPDAQQAQLAEWLLDGMQYHTALPLVEKEFGVKAGKDSYVTFYQEVCVPFLLQRRHRAGQTADAVGEAARSQPGRFDQATIDALKQKAFELTSAPHADPKDVKIFLQLALKTRDQDQEDRRIGQIERGLEQTDRKLKLLEDRAVEAKARLTEVVSKGGLTPETLQLIEQAAGLL